MYSVAYILYVWYHTLFYTYETLIQKHNVSDPTPGIDIWSIPGQSLVNPTPNPLAISEGRGGEGL